MITLNREELRDKIYACWLGKNIGGTMGTPFEGSRTLNDIQGFNSKPGEPLPNDDLDLQLVWLKAVQERGPRSITETVLAAYWQEWITPHWNEYGMGKTNVRQGLMPPLSGDYHNDVWKNSNGAWIRTEVWACLYPCLVDRAVRFAYMDACTDHGVNEGTYAAVFVAAMESAAFAINDLRKLIDIGLSNIPEGCRVSAFIRRVVEMYDAGSSWQEAREEILRMSLADPALGWFQAPGNVAYTVIGLLWGEGDFKRSLIIAIDCGDDTDCTGATAGSLLGIMNGMKAIPEDWKAYIGDRIITVSINRGDDGRYWPNSCTELTQRILDLHPVTLYGEKARVTDGETAIDEETRAGFTNVPFARELARKKPYSFRVQGMFAEFEVKYDSCPDIAAGGELGFTIEAHPYFNLQDYYRVSFVLPEGWSVKGRLHLLSDRLDEARERVWPEHYTLTAGDRVEAENTVLAVLSCREKGETTVVPIPVMG